MQLALPVYLEIFPAENGRTLYAARPLFGGGVERRAATLSRALEQLRGAIGEHLRQLSADPDQRALTEWLSQPQDFQSHSLDLRVADNGQRKFLLVSYRALGRCLAFVARWPRLHFEVPEPSLLADTATRVLTRWVRAAERQPDMPELDELALPVATRTRLSVVELDFEPDGGTRKKAGKPFAGLGGTPGAKRDGAAELRQVGRRWNDLYPHELDRALGRDAELAELERLLAAPGKSAVLLLGQSKVGKTCLLQESLWRHLHETGGAKRALWQLAPMRLISGMSYLGEWEERVLAILEYAEKHGTVLVFDDLPGLFQAGISSGSDLSVGDLLLPWLEQQRVRVIAESTPEAWARLREKHRRFAEQFQVLPLKAPAADQTWTILATLQRQLERQYPVIFALDAVPTAHALCSRFVRDQAFPGNVAALLKRIAALAGRSGDSAAASSTRVRIDRSMVLSEYARSAGIALQLLDGRQALPRAQIESQLEAVLHGQPAAVHALSAALSRFKAGLNDPRRPIGVFLLVGPTGVGKTQCAKAVARFLNGSEQQLLRFDLNEFSSASDAARLIGTARQPEGLLTAAIRRQPCAVVLFDEIEKAAPEVYDLLLGLLDEGRLTDALGRVADFTQSVVLLTSNLGAREAQTEIGFAQSSERGPVYQEAARRFFRPEFFNRLDAVIAFTPFAADELERITRGLIDAVLQRSGMRERQCLLELESSALQALLAAAHDPQLGARALKRGVERALAQPLARLLAAQSGRLPALLRLYLDGSALRLDGVALRPVSHAEPGVPALEQDVSDLRAGLQRIAEQLEALLPGIDALAPSQRLIGLAQVEPAVRHYFALREQQRQLAERIESLSVLLTPRPGRGPLRLPRARKLGLARRPLDRTEFDPARWSQAPLDDLEEPVLAELQRDLHWLQCLCAQPPDPPALCLSARLIGSGGSQLLDSWCRMLEGLGQHLPGVESRLLQRDSLSASFELGGAAASRIGELERGCWLQLAPNGALQVLKVQSSQADDHSADGRVLRLLDARSLADLRSGLELKPGAAHFSLCQWWLAGSASVGLSPADFAS